MEMRNTTRCMRRTTLMKDAETMKHPNLPQMMKRT